MNEHELVETLRKADVATDIPAVPDDLGSHIRRVVTRRRRRKVVGVAAAASLIVTLTALRFLPTSGPEQTAAVARPSDSESREAEVSLAAIRKEAAAVAALAHAMRERRSLKEQRLAAERKLRQYDAGLLARLTLEEVAATRLLEAEQAAKNGDAAAATQSYERVVAMFPTTGSSALAKSRLSEFQQN